MRLASWFAGRRGDMAGVGFVILMAGAFLSPALAHGGVFGPYDLGSALSSLTQGLYTAVHNHLNGDNVTQAAAWNTLDWRAIHSGQLPLWNDYSVLGMPQFFNFESAVLSLPTLLSYVAPLRYALLVAIGVKLVIAGSGAYLLSRVLGVGPGGAAFAGVSYMLAGPFAAWIGWSLDDVMMWAGWIVSLAVLAHRDPRRRWCICLAVTVAFAVYGGFPEAVALLVFFLGLFLLVWALLARPSASVGGVARVAVGVAAGAGLSAPLWLPGISVITGSIRASSSSSYVGLPARGLGLLFAQGFDGLPTGRSVWFGPGNYYESVAYLGLFGVLLAGVALYRWRSRPVVLGLASATLAALAVTYRTSWFHPFQSLINDLDLNAVTFVRSRLLLAFFVAVLAGLGFEALARIRDDPRTRRAFLLAGSGVIGVIMALDIASAREALPGVRSTERWNSLIWPNAMALVIAAVGIGLMFLPARRPGSRLPERVLAGLLIAGQASYLVVAGAGINTYGRQFFPQTTATRRLEQLVGNNLVGIDGTNVDDVRAWTGGGLYPNVNIGYRVREFTGHDPLLPKQYFATFPSPRRQTLTTGSPGIFTPAVTSAAMARRYGISFLLARSATPPPDGTRAIASFTGLVLYKVAEAPRFSFATRSPQAHVISEARTANNAWRLRVATPRPARLVLRVTYEGGWHATSDGHPLTVRRYDGVMASVTVPRGTHTITLTYWPSQLTVGIALAIASALMLAAWPLTARLRRKIRVRRELRHAAPRVSATP